MLRWENLIQAQKLNYSSVHVKRPLITPTQKTCQYFQFIEILSDFALNGPEHFAPSFPIALEQFAVYHISGPEIRTL